MKVLSLLQISILLNGKSWLVIKTWNGKCFYSSPMENNNYFVLDLLRFSLVILISFFLKLLMISISLKKHIYFFTELKRDTCVDIKQLTLILLQCSAKNAIFIIYNSKYSCIS